MTKRPKANFDVEIKKKPKSVENPAQNKDFPISWQISGIDNESRWGYSALRNQVKLISENAVSGLTTAHNDLLDTIVEINGRNFPSLDKMLEKINHGSNGNVTAEEIRMILKGIGENVFWSEIFNKLEHFESNTWYTIEKEQHGYSGKTKHHSVEVSNIIREAQKRLEAMKLEDIDELFSIRLDGKIRLWGIRKYSYIRILWIDLEHEICPSLKK